jgi:hypothetical protein
MIERWQKMMRNGSLEMPYTSRLFRLKRNLSKPVGFGGIDNTNINRIATDF